MENIGTKIRKAREAAGLTQTQLAEMIGVSGQKVISAWEKGSNTPGIDKFARLCKALNVRYEYFFGDIDETSSEAENLLIMKYRNLDTQGRCAMWETARIQTERTEAYSSFSVAPGTVLSFNDKGYERMKERGEGLKDIFRESGLSYEDIASFMLASGNDEGVNTFVLSRVINGKKVPSEKLYDGIIEAVRVLTK